MREREKAASGYANGETASLEAICTRRDPATFMSPRGNVECGASDIVSRYIADAKSFLPGGTTRLEILQSGACGVLAFWTGLQHAEVRMAERDERVPMTLRVTEIFRFEDGGFKLVHRHADALEKG